MSILILFFTNIIFGKYHNKNKIAQKRRDVRNIASQKADIICRYHLPRADTSSGSKTVCRVMSCRPVLSMPYRIECANRTEFATPRRVKPTRAEYAGQCRVISARGDSGRDKKNADSSKTASSPYWRTAETVFGGRKSENIKLHAGIRKDSNPLSAIWNMLKLNYNNLFSLFRSALFLAYPSSFTEQYPVGRKRLTRRIAE